MIVLCDIHLILLVETAVVALVGVGRGWTDVTLYVWGKRRRVRRHVRQRHVRIFDISTRHTESDRLHIEKCLIRPRPTSTADRGGKMFPNMIGEEDAKATARIAQLPDINVPLS